MYLGYDNTIENKRIYNWRKLQQHKKLSHYDDHFESCLLDFVADNKLSNLTVLSLDFSKETIVPSGYHSVDPKRYLNVFSGESFINPILKANNCTNGLQLLIDLNAKIRQLVMLLGLNFYGSKFKTSTFMLKNDFTSLSDIDSFSLSFESENFQALDPSLDTLHILPKYSVINITLYTEKIKPSLTISFDKKTREKKSSIHFNNNRCMLKDEINVSVNFSDLLTDDILLLLLNDYKLRLSTLLDIDVDNVELEHIELLKMIDIH